MEGDEFFTYPLVSIIDIVVCRTTGYIKKYIYSILVYIQKSTWRSDGARQLDFCITSIYPWYKYTHADAVLKSGWQEVED